MSQRLNNNHKKKKKEEGFPILMKPKKRFKKETSSTKNNIRTTKEASTQHNQKIIQSSSNGHHHPSTFINGIPPKLSISLIESIKAWKKYYNNPITSTKNLTLQKDAGSSLTHFLTKCKKQQQQQHTIHKQTNKRSLSSDDNENDSSKGGMMTCCSKFLLEMIHNQESKFGLRRAALKVFSELLHRSRDCRDYFTNTQQLSPFLTTIVSSATNGSDTSNGTSSQLRVLFQQDAIEMLRSISNQYASYYPTLWVASRYLEERNGIVLHKDDESVTSSSSRNNTLRHGRDLALQQFPKIHKRINHIFQRMNQCLDILYPRFCFENEPTIHENMTTVPNKNTFSQESEPTTTAAADPSNNMIENNNDDDDDDDDDIDWEDGDMDVVTTSNENDMSDTKSSIIEVNPSLDHLRNVNETISIMKSTVGVFDEGGIDINLDDDHDHELEGYRNDISLVGSQQNKISTKTSNQMSTNESYEILLQKCVNILSFKYTPKLSFWIECLIGADGMMLQYNNIDNSFSNIDDTPKTSSFSFVLIPASMREKRAPTLQLCLAWKEKIAKMCALAEKLKVKPILELDKYNSHQTSSSNLYPKTRTTQQILPNGSSNSEFTTHTPRSKKQRGLTLNDKLAQKNKKGKTNRIQIKLR